MDNKESNFVSAVVYLHSEDDNTYGFLQMLNTVLSENFKAYELILVDDNVAVSIIENIRRFKNDNPHVICSIISMGFKHGLEASMNAGVDLAIGDFVFEFDSCYIDYPRDLIMEIYKISLRENFDIVCASPYKTRLSSKFFYAIYNKYSKATTPIATERFQVLSRRALNRIYSYSKDIPYRKSVYSAIGLNICQLKYDKISNTSGKLPKETFNFSTAANSLILFTDLTYRFTFGVKSFYGFFDACLWNLYRYCLLWASKTCSWMGTPYGADFSWFFCYIYCLYNNYKVFGCITGTSF